MEAPMSVKLVQVANAFNTFRHLAGFGPITNEDEYDRAMALAGEILDATRGTPQREDATHPLSRLLDWITPAIRAYEAEHFPMPDVEPRAVLQFLMTQHGLSQSDLPEVGNQSVVSQILSGRRALNTRQIAALVARFGVSADAFIVRQTASIH